MERYAPGILAHFQARDTILPRLNKGRLKRQGTACSACKEGRKLLIRKGVHLCH
jgi:hypothetical protein